MTGQARDSAKHHYWSFLGVWTCWCGQDHPRSEARWLNRTTKNGRTQ